MSTPRTIGIVACSKAKLPYATLAADLYQGRLFLLSRELVEATCAQWCILSAKHGLLLPDTIVEPYDETLRLMPIAERRAWAKRTGEALMAQFGADAHFVVYASAEYARALPWAQNVTLPLQGQGIGRQTQTLQRLLRERGQL